MRTTWVGLGLAGLLAVACASTKTYVPEQQANATLGGRTAATYALSGGTAGRGNLRVASFGISDAKTAKGVKSKVAHLRMAISNEGTEPISVDTRQQRVQLPNGAQIAPAWAKASTGAMPQVSVPQASSRTIDLFFPLPEEVAKAKAPPTFDVAWRVDVGGTSVAKVTPFNQVAVDPAVARQQAAEDIEFGAYDWYDPGWGPGAIGAPDWGW